MLTYDPLPHRPHLMKPYHLHTHTNRTATKSEISKAYRKLARKWHPDSYDGEDQEKAEKMFLDIAAAKEVLTDPGKRSSYVTS